MSIANTPFRETDTTPVSIVGYDSEGRMTFHEHADIVLLTMPYVLRNIAQRWPETRMLRFDIGIPEGSFPIEKRDE